MTLDQLEGRRHFSSSVLTNRVLTVTGTNGNDLINVGIIGGVIVVEINGGRQRFLPDSISSFVVFGLSGNDHISLAGVISGRSLVRGGAGNDVLTGGVGPDRLFGDSGDDVLDGRSGNDALDGGSGSDLLNGGAGRDTVTYASRTAPLSLSIARGGYDDGAAGERDNIRGDIEAIVSGSGNDTITGWTSDDYIDGGAGDDTIDGDRKDDTLNGGDGNDSISGNDGDDSMSGGNGDDLIYSGDGNNFLRGDGGNDTLRAHNHATDDTLDGGAGEDHCRYDENVGTYTRGHDDVYNMEHKKRFTMG